MLLFNYIDNVIKCFLMNCILKVFFFLDDRCDDGWKGVFCVWVDLYFKRCFRKIDYESVGC